jgi:4-hydroxythreonine-4-phosphate dehydrogenase
MLKDKPVLGITMGDPASIGPEIAAKAGVEKKLYEMCNPVIIGDAKVMENAVKSTNAGIKINAIDEPGQARFERGILDVIDLKNVDMKKLAYGKISAMCGDAAFEYVKKAIDLAMENYLDGTVTGPIHKESINLAGHHFSGHTEIYAHFTNTKKYGMLLVDENMSVIHVSTHVSLRQACDLVTKERVLDVIQLMNTGLKRIGIQNPRIGVAGLNPHASDGGLFGDEEEKEIIPAVKTAMESGINVEGPIPADTLFSKAKGGSYDGCVAMYHDQGHIPFKLDGFVWNNEKKSMESVRGVNITVGLPIIRTSVDHGTAFEIAGKGIASHEALMLATEYATKMATGNK